MVMPLRKTLQHKIYIKLTRQKKKQDHTLWTRHFDNTVYRVGVHRLYLYSIEYTTTKPGYQSVYNTNTEYRTSETETLQLYIR